MEKKKKKYEKPQILIENFKLTQSVARSCEVQANFNEGACGVKYWIYNNVFTGYSGGCTQKVADGSPIVDGLCYSLHDDSFNVFTS